MAAGKTPSKPDGRMKLLVAGYYGFDNLGDEWLLELLLDALKPHSHHITVLSRQPQVTQKKYHVYSISRWNPFKLMTALGQHEVLILGGGGLIQDLSGFKSPFYYLSLCALAKLFGKKVILVSQGIGPIKHHFNQLLCHLILPWVDQVIARDHTSAMTFQDYGVPYDQLTEAADLVWLKKFNPALQSPENKWIICLRADWLDHDLPTWLKPLCVLARTNHKTVGFIPLGNRGDEALVEKIKSNSLYSDCLFYDQHDWVTAFTQAEMVISMRYHGLILGALAGAMLVGMGADQKISNLIESMEQIMVDQDSLIPVLTSKLTRAAEYQQLIKTNREMMIKKAKQNIITLQTYLLLSN